MVSLQFFCCEWHFQALCPSSVGIFIFSSGVEGPVSILRIFSYLADVFGCVPSALQFLFTVVFDTGKFLLFLFVIKFISLLLYVFCLCVMLRKSFPIANSKIHLKCFHVALWFLFYIKL